MEFAGPDDDLRNRLDSTNLDSIINYELGNRGIFLNVDYGASQKASVQDTVFFWIVPWQQLLMMGVISLIAIVFLALYFHRWLEVRHHQKFALAHGLPMPEPGELPYGRKDYLGNVKNTILWPVRKVTTFLTREKPASPSVIQEALRQKPSVIAPPIETMPPFAMPIQKMPPTASPIPERPSSEKAKTDVIDLKNMRVHEESHVPHESQVINLKKRT